MISKRKFSYKINPKVTCCLIVLISLSSCDFKPRPKTGEVVYDVPSLFGKNIDKIIHSFNKSYETYQDTFAPKEKYKVILRDENSEIREGYPKDNDGSFFFIKDGWRFGVGYDVKTREINNICIGSAVPAFEHLCLNNVQELLLIGNLNKDSQDYDLSFQDCFLSEFSLDDKYTHHEFGSVCVTPKNKNQEKQ